MEKHDVLIIGSGASGGMIAHTLTRRGITCLMLDAGPVVDLKRDRVLRPVSELPFHGFGDPKRFPHVTQANEFNGNAWADEKENPYTYPENDPYYWVRARMIGGKTMLWGRASWRFSDHVFAAKDIDGFGDNWPIRYSELASYYDKAEPLFRVSGRKDGIPQIPDGNFIEDNSMDSGSIQRFVAACKQQGIPTTKARRATGELASSSNLLLPEALATGNLTIVPNAVVRQLSVDRNTGLVDGAHFVDRHSRREMQVKARVVVVGASTLESTRLLLNSGIANSSGVLGHYLHDQIYVKTIIQAVVPEARDGKAPRGLMGGAGYIPRFRNLNKPEKDKRFIRGYAVDFHSGGTPSAKLYPAYGPELRKLMARDAGAAFQMTAMGEVLARKENFVRINKDVKDAWGIPALHIQHKYTDNEFEMAKDAMHTLEEACHGAGFDVIAKHWEMVPPGESIHEIGTCRMGNDPKTSVLNKYNQSHDIKNLFVIDGSSFVSGGSQNPTLTILALAMRAGDYLAEQFRSGAL